MGGASWLPSNSEILRGPGILWILGQCPWEAALWGLWTVERAAHLDGCGSHSAEQSLSQAYKGGPGCGWSLFSALVTPLHTKGSHTNTARSWSFTALWPAGPLTHRVLQTPPNPSRQYCREGMSHQPQGHSALGCTKPGLQALACQCVFASISKEILSTHVCMHTQCACVCTYTHAHILPLCEASELH